MKFKPRKIMQIGNSLLISIPIDFVRNNNLKPGNFLEISLETENSLMIKNETRAIQHN